MHANHRTGIVSARVNYGTMHARCLTCDAPTSLSIVSTLPARYTLADLEAATYRYVCTNGHTHGTPARYTYGSYAAARQLEDDILQMGGTL